MRKSRTTLNKATIKRLSSIGYKGENEPYAVFLWLMEKHRYYVMTHPKTSNVWGVWVVILGKPNTIDGKLNMCDLEEETDCYDSALVVGVEFVVKSLYEARKAFLTKSEEEIEKIVESCRKQGFAV